MLRAWTKAIRREDSFLGSYLSPATSAIPGDAAWGSMPSRHLSSAASVPVQTSGGTLQAWRPAEGENCASGFQQPQSGLPPRSPIMPGAAGVPPRHPGIASLSLPPDIRADYERVQLMYQSMQQVCTAMECGCFHLDVCVHSKLLSATHLLFMQRTFSVVCSVHALTVVCSVHALVVV